MRQANKSIIQYLLLIGLIFSFNNNLHAQCASGPLVGAELVRTYPMVFTCGADEVTDIIMAMADAPSTLSYNSASQSPGEYMNAGWTIANIGNIYFTEFDEAGNIYAPATKFTEAWKPPYSLGVQQFGILGGGGGDVIYKMDAVSGNPSVWATINTSSEGFGGITYNSCSGSMYVVNMGNATIYRLNISTGAVLGSFQPVLGVVSGFQAVPFGLDLYDGRLYYTVHDYTGGGSLVVRSVALLSSGEIDGGTDMEEISQVMIESFGYEPVSADIDFNSEGLMAVGSLTPVSPLVYYQNISNKNIIFNHGAGVYIFSGGSGSWTEQRSTTVGQFSFFFPNDNKTAIGGVAWNIDQDTSEDILWMSGHDVVVEDDVGIVGYNSTQLTTMSVQETAASYIHFNFAPQTSDDPKGNGGDVDVFSFASLTFLPVELSFFGVEATNAGVLAKWTTESETENLGFTLDRRVEGTAAWSEITSYAYNDALLGQGSTPSATDYEYLDALVTAGTTYEYRLADVDYKNTVTYHATRTVTVSSTPSTREVPDEFTVKEAYPNPFNPSTTIDYYIPLNPPSIKGDDVVGGLSIQIYDITGKLITTLIDQVQPSGWHSVQWNGKDQVGVNVPAGAYLVRVKAGTEVRHTKVMLLK